MVSHDDVSTLIAEGKSNDIDVLVGSNRDEGAFPFFGVPRGNAQEFTRRCVNASARRRMRFSSVPHWLGRRIECVTAGGVS